MIDLLKSGAPSVLDAEGQTVVDLECVFWQQGASALEVGDSGLGGAGGVLFVLLRLAFDRIESMDLMLEPLAPAVAAAAIGSLAWVYHRGLARGSAETLRQGSRLVTSGVALVAAACGIGVSARRD